jgi:hypothetical protein
MVMADYSRELSPKVVLPTALVAVAGAACAIAGLLRGKRRLVEGGLLLLGAGAVGGYVGYRVADEARRLDNVTVTTSGPMEGVAELPDDPTGAV